MNLYDALLKDMPSAAFKLNSAGTGYDDVTGHGNTLTGTLTFVSPLVNGNKQALSLKTASVVTTTTSIFKHGTESQPFSLTAWVLPTTFTGNIAILSHNAVYDGLSFDGNNIIFRIRYNTLPDALITWPVPDFPEAVHIVGTYSRDKIQLYVNKVLQKELELTQAQYLDGFRDTASPTVLYSGQSASGNERIIADGFAIFNRVLSATSVAKHFDAGRNVPTVANIIGQNSGVYFDGVHRDIVLQQTWSTVGEWQAGVYSDLSFASGHLTPAVDLATHLSLPGIWRGSLGIGSIPLTDIEGVKISWNGDGIYTVATSLDGLVYTSRSNGEVVPGTQGINPTGGVLDVRITFTGGVALDVASVRDLTLTVYSTNKVHGSSATREIALTGAVSTALESNEPIERNSAAGMSFYGGYGTLSTDLTAGSVRTNLCTNPSFEVDTTSWINYGTAPGLSRSLAQFLYGVASLKIAPTSSGIQGAYFNAPCTAGLPYTFSTWFYRQAGSAVCKLTADWHKADTTLISSLSAAPITTDLGGWVRVAITGIAPALATNVSININYTAAVANTDVGYVDNVLIEQSSILGTYFDGYNGGIWTGTANASTSVDSIYNPQTVGALGFWVKPSALPASSYIFDARAGYTGYIYSALGVLTYVGHSAVYVNGVLAASATKSLTIGEWTHIMYVPTTPITTSILLGTNSSLTGLFSGQVALVAAYPVAPTAGQVLVTFNSYAVQTTVTAIDTAGITITELSDAYSNYVLDWSAAGATS